MYSTCACYSKGIQALYTLCIELCHILPEQQKLCSPVLSSFSPLPVTASLLVQIFSSVPHFQIPLAMSFTLDKIQNVTLTYNNRENYIFV